MVAWAGLPVAVVGSPRATAGRPWVPAPQQTRYASYFQNSFALARVSAQTQASLRELLESAGIMGC